MPRRNSNVRTANEEINLLAAAMAGGLTMSISPETVEPVPTSSAWTRDVVITILDKDGNICEWLTQDYAASAAIADTSTAGTATIASTTLSVVNGVAVVTVSGDAEDWLDTETDTLTISNLTVMGYTVTGGTSVETFTAV